VSKLRGVTSLRLKPVIVITALVPAVTLAAVAGIVHSTYERPNYNIHRVFETQAEYMAFSAQLRAMPGVFEAGSSVGYRKQIEADFKVTAPREFPYGTADYTRNYAVVFPILLCLLALGTLWGFALQKKVRQDGLDTE
jgi:hypothetical protein